MVYTIITSLNAYFEKDITCLVLNCTVKHFTLQNQDWGVAPKSDGTWGGLMGGVVNGDYMISLSTWVWNIERNNLLDFVPILSDRVMLATTPKNPEIDITLFLRPFTKEAWQGIGLTLIFIVLCIMIPYGFIIYYEYTDG